MRLPLTRHGTIGLSVAVVVTLSSSLVFAPIARADDVTDVTPILHYYATEMDTGRPAIWDSGNCSKAVGSSVQEVNAMLQHRDLTRAMSYGRVDAAVIAQCYFAKQPSDLSLEMSAALLGRLLLLSGAAARIDDGATDATEHEIVDARALLTYAQNHGQQTRSDLDEANKLLKPAAAPTPGAPAGKMTARAAVTAYQANTFGFRQRYEGKTLVIDGPVSSIGGSGSNVAVQIVGIEKPNSNYADRVACEVTSPHDLQIAATLAPGQHVTATGLYTPDDMMGTLMIQLKSCSLK